MLIIKKGILKITEQTIRELIGAIDKAKDEITFTEDPIPADDMDTETYWKMKAERGEILVTSEFAPIDFLIQLETRPHSQESVGYRFKIKGKEE